MNGDRILIIGYGNPARGDDGLGPALAERLEAMGIPGVTVEVDYQLSIEHAEMAAGHDIVVFADADGSSAVPFYLEPVKEEASGRFTSHSVAPGEVLRIARSCFGAAPAAYLLGMRGEAFEPFTEGLSPSAREGLSAALEHLSRFIAGNRGKRTPQTPEAKTC